MHLLPSNLSKIKMNLINPQNDLAGSTKYYYGSQRDAKTKGWINVYIDDL